MSTVTTSQEFNILTSAPDSIPPGFIQVSADMRYKGEVTKQMTEEEFKAIRVRRILVPSYTQVLSENGIPAKYIGILSDKLTTIANEFLSDYLAKDRNQTKVNADYFDADFLLSYFAEKNAPKTLTSDDVFAWAKTSSFASRHRAKFNDEARTLTYLSFFNQFADKAGITATLNQLQTITGLFVEDDLTPIGQQVKARIDNAIIRMGKKTVELDDIC